MRAHYVGSITNARAKLPEFEALRDAARDIKNHTLAHLDLYLEELERKVTEAGGHVHWASTAGRSAQPHRDDLPATPMRAPSPRASR